MKADARDKELFVRIAASRFHKCLDRTMNCSNKAIRAHSVQNATALSLIENDNHVTELRPKIVDDKPVCRFERVGRNNASTFTGLCGDHDREVFRPIDMKPLELNDLEQLFLIAYRSVTRELHAAMESGSKIQGAYNTQVSRGQIPGDKPTQSGIAATEQLYKAWSTWRYRFKFYDQAFVTGDFGSILHSTFLITGKPPVLAASAFFGVDDRALGKNLRATTLNGFPVTPQETALPEGTLRHRSPLYREGPAQARR